MDCLSYSLQIAIKKILNINVEGESPEEPFISENLIL